MDERRKGALRKCHQDLRAGLLVGNVLPAFHPFLTGVEYSRVRDREDNVERVDELIEILLTKENRHFEEFCAALEGNGYEHWARRLRKEVDLVESSVVDHPPSQVQVHYPILDDLADDFSILIADVAIKIQSLSRSRLVALKACIEEKLKSKHTSVSIPSSAEELISTLNKYWDFLNFEIAQLVVRYLRDDELQAQLKEYEAKLKTGARKLLVYCKKNGIPPKMPPSCSRMVVTVIVDPYSFSLHRILEMKDFLLRIGMKVALFAGWSHGSIILHFYVLESYMKIASHQLKKHELQLSDMQVMAIEMDGVLIYHTPVRDLGLKVKMAIDCISDDLRLGGKIIVAMQQFDKVMVAAADAVLRTSKELHNEEIKRMHEVKMALNSLFVVAEKAIDFLDKMDDVVQLCKGSMMAVALKELRSFVDMQQAGGLKGAFQRGYDALLNMMTHTGDLYQLRDLLETLENAVARAQTILLEFTKVCDTAVWSFDHATEGLERKAEEAHDKKTGVIGDTAYLLLGLVREFLVPQSDAPVDSVGATGAVTAHSSGSEFMSSEGSFRSIQQHFYHLLKNASDLKEGVAEVHANLETISTMVDTIAQCIRDGIDCSIVLHALERLNVVCKRSHDTTSRCRNSVGVKILELKKNVW